MAEAWEETGLEPAEVEECGSCCFKSSATEDLEVDQARDLVGAARR